MKKIFILSAVVLTAMFMGCSKEDMISQDVELGFNVGENTTRAAIQDNTTILKENLKVYSFYEADGAKWRNFDLRYTNGAWSYGTAVYHPLGTIKHYSTVPDQLGNFNSLTNKTLAFDYTVAPVDRQVDLLGVTTNTSQAASSNGWVTANLVYKHLLSKINFTVKGYTGLKIVIKNITINQVYDRGVYTFGNNWNVNTGQSSSYVYTWADFADITKDTDGFANLMLMPQNVKNGKDSFTFDYEVYESGALLAKGTDGYVFQEVWDPGKSYRYVIDLTCDVISKLPKLKFTVSVEPWDADKVINTK